jgi:putative endonuclease
MAAHNELGKIGEELAFEYLIQKGYEIKERNWRHQKAEVDIIAIKDGVLAIVEVKTRSTDFFGDPKTFINKKKINLLVSAIDKYVRLKGLNVEVRFDVIGIIMRGKKTQLEHVEDAFYHF